MFVVALFVHSKLVLCFELVVRFQGSFYLSLLVWGTGFLIKWLGVLWAGGFVVWFLVFCGIDV